MRALRVWFSGRPVGAKIGTVIGLCLALLLIQAAHDLYRVDQLTNDSEVLYRQNVTALASVADASTSINQMRQRVLLYVLDTPAQRPGRRAEIEALDASFDAATARVRSAGGVPTTAVDDWTTLVATYRSYRDTVILPAADANVGGAQLATVLAECARLFAPIEQTQGQLSKIAMTSAADRFATAQKAGSQARLVLVGLLFFGLVLGGGLGTVVTRMVVAPLAEVRRVLDAIAGGDLTQRIGLSGSGRGDQIATSLQRALDRVRTTVATLATSADRVAEASRTFSTNSTRIAAAALQTSDETVRAESAVQEISQNVQTVAAGAHQMSDSIREIATNAAEAAEVGAQAVAAAELANTQVSKLGESSVEVGNVIKVITSIANQTNLLALNATIEAARAGEAGKGFAVVADEVKQLAQETARATGDIGHLIEAIQSDTRGAVMVIGEIAQVIERINAYQTTIAGAVEEQTATTSEMSRSAEVAAGNSERVNGNITSVARAAATTTQGVQDAQEAALNLTEMSAELRAVVDEFTY